VPAASDHKKSCVQFEAITPIFLHPANRDCLHQFRCCCGAQLCLRRSAPRIQSVRMTFSAAVRRSVAALCGWLGPLALAPGWYANILLAISLSRCFRGRRPLTSKAEQRLGICFEGRHFGRGSTPVRSWRFMRSGAQMIHPYRFVRDRCCGFRRDA